MAQKVLQSDKFGFQVETAPSFMRLPNGEFVPDGFFVNRRTDTNDVLGKVSNRYGLIQNGDLVSAAEDAFKASSMGEFKRKIIVTGSGEKTYAVYDFPNRVKKLSVGDEVGLRLTVQNSFDGSLRASFALGVLRLLCLNGMTTMEREVSMTKKHSFGISVQFITSALEKAIAMWERSTQVYERLAIIGITQPQGLAILTNLENAGALSGKLRDGAASVWNAPRYAADSNRNLYNLYNALTQHLTHEVAGERFELANRASETVLALLAKAAMDAKRLADLSVIDVESTIVEA